MYCIHDTRMLHGHDKHGHKEREATLILKNDNFYLLPAEKASNACSEVSHYEWECGCDRLYNQLYIVYFECFKTANTSYNFVGSLFTCVCFRYNLCAFGGSTRLKSY